MLFREQFTISRLELCVAEPISLEWPEMGKRLFIDRPLPSSNITNGYTMIERQPPDAVMPMLASVAAGRLPSGSTIKDLPPDGYNVETPGGSKTFAPGKLPLPAMPESIQTFLTDLQTDARQFVRDTVALVRWRFGYQGKQNPINFAKHGSMFSMDGESWHEMPGTVDATFLPFVCGQHLRNKEASIVQSIVSQKKVIPLSYDLFLEAAEHRLSNPRSAFVSCMMAVEIAVKEYISAKMPHASWLMEESPSPSVFKMVTQYLPILSQTDELPKLEVPDRIRKYLRAGMEGRNKLVHTGTIPIDNKDFAFARSILESSREMYAFFNAMSDLAWILQFNLGNDWAKDELSYECQLELKLITPVPIPPRAQQKR